MQNLTTSATPPVPVQSVKLDQCANLAIITLAAPLVGANISPILMSSASVPTTAMLNTYDTLDAYSTPFLALTQGNQAQCQAFNPQYSQYNMLCTQPVQGQTITSDYLGGDPIIGFSVFNNTPSAVLVGITGQYYSTFVFAQTGRDNDPGAYRFSALVAPSIGTIAAAAGVSAANLTNPNPLG
ncbi:hypothetical protein IWW38_006209 [Coemansia aciculifera]|uniref:Uncharacterized protein n=1 Tax=Coemansia aciculifera TaxID=417176 RepID=A0ACC1LUC7_9FUNG|nr:hypothetical protein IWW38_006209 [Coemansia aciculifera]